MTDINLDDFEVYRTTGNPWDAHCNGDRLVLVEKGEYGPDFCPFCESMQCLEEVE